MKKSILYQLMISFFLIGHVQAEIRIDGRWFSAQQVDRGNVLFQANCAVCHKADASGTANWSKLDANDKYPPPPLNGTAHTWHHSLKILRRVIREGGIELGGSMPGFADKFNDKQILDILAWIQNHWSDEIYSAWIERYPLRK